MEGVQRGDVLAQANAEVYVVPSRSILKYRRLFTEA
jgi:hypothetical protein